MPKTSIIIATHSRPRLLLQAVESARRAGTNIEIVVVDDASTDETANLCKRLAGIKYVRVNENHGVAGARNVGLNSSEGEYVTFLDDDDTREPNSLDDQISVLERDPGAGLVYGQAFLVGRVGSEQRDFYPRVCPEGDVFWHLISQNFIPCGSVVFRRSVLAQVGLLNDAVAGIDDWDLWVRIAAIYRIIAHSKPVINWRRSTPRSGQGTSQAAALVLKSITQFHNCWINLPHAAEASAQRRQIAWKQFSANMAEHLIWESVRALGYLDLPQAFKNLSIVPKLHPLALVNAAGSRLFPALRNFAFESSTQSMSSGG